MGVSEDGRPPSSNIIQQPIPIDVEQVSTGGGLDEKWRTTHGPKSADRGIDTTWEMFQGSFEKSFGPGT